jgi:ParB family chromosome partitioning protein
MKVMMERILRKEHIRKDISKIPELAEDIRVNGLLNPVTVMALDDGDYQLLAGLRRVKAVQSLGQTQIAVNIVAPADAEAALRIEVSENEQREGFTFSEKMDYARLLEDIEKAKALERMLAGKSADPTDPGPEGGETRDIIGAKIGMSGRQYDRAKYVADNAPEEVIDQLDKGERSIRGTYDELRAQEKESTPNPRPQLPIDPLEEEMIQRARAFDALPPEGKIADLQRQLKEMRCRAVTAESEAEDWKRRYGIATDHKDSIIDMLKRQVAQLEAELEVVSAKLEAVIQ